MDGGVLVGAPAGGRETLPCAGKGPVAHHNLTIPSDFTAAREVQKRILDDVKDNAYSAQAAFAIQLALEEALINAVKHGNKFDVSKKVHVQASIDPKQAKIVVEDEGTGFDPSGVPDPTLEENLEKCSGRGILLIGAYMDNVEWTNGGRCLRMTKKNEDGEK
jgi:serine/threonine-protein kinase RsbW